MRMFTLPAFVCACIALFLCPAPSMGADPIRIGVINGYPAPFASYGTDMVDGVKLAISEINGKGGVNDSMLECIVGSGSPGLGEVKDLVLKEHAKVLVGSLSGDVALTVADFARDQKIPFLETFSDDETPVEATARPYVFHMHETGRMGAAAAAILFHEKLFTKYWVAGEDDDYGHALGRTFWNGIKKLEPEFQLLGESWWKPGETDLSPYIDRILAAKPQFLVVATRGLDTVNFQKAAKALGFTEKIPFYQHSVTDITMSRQLGADAQEGVYGTTSYLFYNPSIPANKAFVDAFRKAYGRYPGSGAFYGYVSVMFVSEGMKKTGVVDGAKLVAAMEGMRLSGPVGTVAMRPCDHQLALPVFLSKTSRDQAYPDFLMSNTIQGMPAGYYMEACGEEPRTAAK